MMNFKVCFLVLFLLVGSVFGVHDGYADADKWEIRKKLEQKYFRIEADCKIKDRLYSSFYHLYLKYHNREIRNEGLDIILQSFDLVRAMQEAFDSSKLEQNKEVSEEIYFKFYKRLSEIESFAFHSERLKLGAFELSIAEWLEESILGLKFDFHRCESKRKAAFKSLKSFIKAHKEKAFKEEVEFTEEPPRRQSVNEGGYLM